jgi:hypothetical protein
MGSYEMLALFIIFRMVLLTMWSGLTAVAVIDLKTSDHLNNRGGTPGLVEEKTSLVDEAMHRGHNSSKSAKRGARRLHKVERNPLD